MASDNDGPADPIKRFLRLIEGLRPEGVERSFKMAAGNLLEDRYLMGVRKEALSPELLSDICTGLGMPAADLRALLKNLPEARSLHFGFENSPTGTIYKVYLEFWDRLNAALAARPVNREPLVLHLAYKWDAAGAGKSAVAEYRCFPELQGPEVFERLRVLYDGDEPPSLEAAERIINMALRRTRKTLMYLEVSESGNPRASFDIRLYPAELNIADIHPWLVAASRAYVIAPRQFDLLYGQVRNRALGHISGGIDRAGRDFLTVYYAAQ
jgi:tryptophan halogenase